MAINIPQVGNAPIAPPTQPTLNQEAFTAVLPTTENLNQDLLKASQLNLAMKEAKRQRDQKQLEDNVKMFDFNTVGVWDRDVDAINKMKEDGIKKFGSVDFLKRYNSGDLNALTEYQNWKTSMDSAINTSKFGQAHYLEGIKTIGKDRKYQNPETQNAFDAFSKNPLDPNYPQIQIGAPQYNQYEYINGITPKQEKNENGVRTTSVTPIQDIIGLIESGKQTPDVSTPFNEHWTELITDANADLMQNPNGGTMANPITEYYDQAELKKGKFVVKSKPLSDFTIDEIPYTRQIFDPAYSKSVTFDEPKSTDNDGSGNDKEPSNLTWVIDGLADIKKGTEQTTTDTKSTQGNTIKYSKMFIGQKIPQGVDAYNEPIMKTLSSISNKNGKTYVTFEEDKSSTGNAPLVPINNEWNEIVLPIIQDKYGDDALEELKRYAKKQGVSSLLGIPELTQTEVKVTETKKTGTQQQVGVKSGVGAFDDLGTTPQKKSQVINAPQTNQQVAPKKQVVTPKTNTTAPQQQVTPQKTVTPPQTTTVKTPTVNSGTSNWGKTNNLPTETKSEPKTFSAEKGSYNGGNDYSINGEIKYQKGEDIEFGGKKYEVKNFFEDGKPNINRIEKYDDNGKMIEARNVSTNQTYKYSYFETEDGTKYYHNRGACGAEFCFNSYWGTEKPDKPSVGNFNKQYMYAYKGNDATMVKPPDLKTVNSIKKIYSSADKYYKLVNTEEGDVYVEQIKNSDGTFTDKKHNYSSK